MPIGVKEETIPFSFGSGSDDVASIRCRHRRLRRYRRCGYRLPRRDDISVVRQSLGDMTKSSLHGSLKLLVCLLGPDNH